MQRRRAVPSRGSIHISGSPLQQRGSVGRCRAPSKAIPTSTSPRTLQLSTSTHPQPGLASPRLALSCTTHRPPPPLSPDRSSYLSTIPCSSPSCFTILATIVLDQQSRQCVRSSASTVGEPFSPLPSPDLDGNASFLHRNPSSPRQNDLQCTLDDFSFRCCTDSCISVGQAGCQIANSCWEVSFASISTTRVAARSTNRTPKISPPRLALIGHHDDNY